jgi:GNAT superfamily N-acetyltransferase
MHYRLLPPPLAPLADKFYRSQRPPMRTNAGGDIWVAQSTEITAALRLRQVEGGIWLTSLLVASDWRGQGIASQLIAAALADCQEPVWLFCNPQLAPLYERLGFSSELPLPPSLQQRLSRYQQKKPLLALSRAPALQIPGSHTNTI